MRALPVLVAVLAAMLPRPAVATSCSKHPWYETFALHLTGLYVGTKRVGPPPGLKGLDELSNRDGGLGLMLEDRASNNDAGKLYRLDRTLPPTAGIADHIRATVLRHKSNPCGRWTPFRPLLPGRYTLIPEDSEESTWLPRVTDMDVIVAPGRDRIELRFRTRGRRYRAVYEVLCAYFAVDGEPPRCGLTEETPQLASALAAAMAAPPITADVNYNDVILAIAPPLPEPVSPDPTAETPASSAATPPEPAAEVTPERASPPSGALVHDPPASHAPAPGPPPSPARCNVGSPTVIGLAPALALLLLLLRR